MSDLSKAARRSIWKRRRRRVVTGVNVLVGVVLMLAVVVLLNMLTVHFPLRVQLDSHLRYQLSERTMSMLKGLHNEVDIVAFLGADDSEYDNVRALLKEYAYAANEIDGLEINLDIVNPSRDIARTRELARDYDVKSEDVIVFSSGGKKKYVEVKDLVKYKIKLSRQGISRKAIAFFGEQMFSSAILSVTQDTTPVIYFITGHGERDIDDFGRQGGYSDIARTMRRDNMEVKKLSLAEKGGIPADCSALVIAGPDRRYSKAELRIISDYLQSHHGRVLFLLDPSVSSGFEKLLGVWGVKLGTGVVAGLTLTGRELVINKFGAHAITQAFRNVSVMFYMPRPILKNDPAGGDTDSGQVTVLASTGKEGWFESDLSQDPPRFDRGSDRVGPVSVAVAVEKGDGLGVDVELQPTRIVVIGDSYFISNAALKNGVGGNSDFFLASLNWLIERESLLRVAPRKPFELNPDMSRADWRKAFLIMVLMIPGLIALLGLIVWMVRRR